MNDEFKENSIDKTLLRVLHPFGLKLSLGCHTLIQYKGIDICKVDLIHIYEDVILLEPKQIHLDFKNDLFKISAIRCAISFISRQSLGEYKRIEFKQNIEFEIIFKKFGFLMDNNKIVYKLNPKFIISLHSAYNKIKNAIENQEPPLSISDNLLNNDEAFSVQSEYNDIAWGFTNWARNSVVQEDELLFIQKNISGGYNLEIGVGSGRLTEHILLYSKFLLGTDREIGIINSLREKLKDTKLELMVDDFIETKLEKGRFDNVLFLENGLGSMLDVNLRKKVFINAHKVLKNNGYFLLGVRSLGSKSLNQVMPTTQDATIYGVYRTFSKAEIEKLIKNYFDIIEVINGNNRPAGGHQLLFKLKKVG